VAVGQFAVPASAGAMTFSGSNVSCATASNLTDRASLRYVTGYERPSSDPFCPLVSQGTVALSCTPCATQLYPIPIVANGSASVPGIMSSAVSCATCPYHGACADGDVVASPGYWGAPSADGSISFQLCPSGYCCGSSPCGSMDGCNGHRRGPLCGHCDAGYTEALFSTRCVATSRCRAWHWAVVAAALVVRAAVWAYSAGIIFPSKDKAALIGLALNYMQVRRLHIGVAGCVVALWSPSLRSSALAFRFADAQLRAR
jgi:hypothetical protein